MSNKPRCKDCNHRPGPRSTNNMTRDGQRRKKRLCVHECHRSAPLSATPDTDKGAAQ